MRRCDVNDLPTLDSELYRNLMHLRDYQGDASDLALTFTVGDSALGVHREARAPPFVACQSNPLPSMRFSACSYQFCRIHGNGRETCRSCVTDQGACFGRR